MWQCHSRMRTGSPVHALGDGQMLSGFPRLALPAKAGAQQEVTRHLLPLWCLLSHSSLRSQENFGLNCVPSLLLSCGHHSQRRVTCPGVRGCPSFPCMPAGQSPLP